RQGELAVADAIGGDLQEILKERNAPACKRGDEPRAIAEIFQMCVPRERHKDVRSDQQHDRPDYCRHTTPRRERFSGRPGTSDDASHLCVWGMELAAAECIEVPRRLRAKRKGSF